MNPKPIAFGGLTLEQEGKIIAPIPHLVALRARLFGAVYGYAGGQTGVQVQFEPIDSRGIPDDADVIVSFSAVVSGPGFNRSRVVSMGTDFVKSGEYGRAAPVGGNTIIEVKLRPGEHVEALHGAIQVQIGGVPLLVAGTRSPTTAASFTVHPGSQTSYAPPGSR